MTKGKQQKPDLVEEKAVNVTFRCPESVQYELRKIALHEDRNLSKQVVHALKGWLRDRGQQ